MWCHLLLALPALGLIVFLFFPLAQSLALYLPVALLSTIFYYWMFQTMKQPVQMGKGSFVGKVAEVVARQNSARHPHYVVRYDGELWNATSSAILEPGQSAKIVAVKGLGLVLEEKDEDSPE